MPRHYKRRHYNVTLELWGVRDDPDANLATYDEDNIPNEYPGEARVWIGKGSLQPGMFHRTRVEVPDPFEWAGAPEEVVFFTAFLPYAAMPQKGDWLRDEAGRRFEQIRPPMNAGGMSLHWQLDLGSPTGG